MHIDHINIVVRGDLDVMVAFYRDRLGLEVTKQACLRGEWIETVTGVRGAVADCVYLETPEPGPRVELLKYHAPAADPLPATAPHSAGIRHIAFRVDDLDARHERLRAAGVVFIGPPIAVPGAVVQHEQGQKRLCYFHDPEGNLLELAEFR